MPGTFIFKPIEANLTHNTDIITKMNPYCILAVGNNTFKGQVCKKGGKHPHWNDAITIPATSQSTAVIDIMDKDKISKDDVIGTSVIDLMEVQSRGHVSKWYPLSYKNKPAGEVLVECIFQPDPSLAGASVSGQSEFYREEQIGFTQPGFVQEEVITNVAPTTFVQEGVIAGQTGSFQQTSTNTSALSQGTNVFTEQRQFVEPHTFTKEVDVVETRQVLKEIEVSEPQKVMRDVLVTEAVPVTRQIEVSRPEVVRKEIEVIEPQLVTKTIQVVENVPVKKQVDVIEPRTELVNFQTMEPQTFHKQVEVTENVQVRRQVEVSEPVTFKKNVEFVEPIIHTKTVVKETQQPIVVDEKITTTIGPATLVGVETEYREEALGTQFSKVTISEQERILQERRLEEERLLQQRRLEEERLLLEQGGLLQQGQSGYSSTTYQSSHQTNLGGIKKTGLEGNL